VVILTTMANHAREYPNDCYSNLLSIESVSHLTCRSLSSDLQVSIVVAIDGPNALRFLDQVHFCSAHRRG
jgi:hypothetical protein